jgi:CheY-like chemotaxis protein
VSRELSHAPDALDERADVPRTRVLVADDYPDAADTLAALLTLAGFDVQIARDGQDAFERMQVWRPQVCVLDLSMPKLDGIDIARWIQQHAATERPLLIALTGWGRVDDQRRAHEAGFDRHFTKPADPAEIVRVIKPRCRPQKAVHG